MLSLSIHFFPNHFIYFQFIILLSNKWADPFLVVWKVLGFSLRRKKKIKNTVQCVMASQRIVVVQINSFELCGTHACWIKS